MIVIPLLIAGMMWLFLFSDTGSRLTGITAITDRGAQIAALTDPEEQLNLIATMARPIIWLIGFQLWKANPIFGIGHFNTVIRIGPYLPPVLRPIQSILFHFHSIYFNTLFEGGILCFGALLWFLIRVINYVFGGIRHRGHYTGYSSLALGAVWVQVFVHGFVDTTFALGSHYLEAGIFFLYLALHSFTADRVKRRRNIARLKERGSS